MSQEYPQYKLCPLRGVDSLWQGKVLPPGAEFARWGRADLTRGLADERHGRDGKDSLWVNLKFRCRSLLRERYLRHAIKNHTACGD